MADLSSNTIASTYDRLLALPSGGLNGATLVALTDGDAGGTLSLQVSTGKINIKPSAATVKVFEVQESDTTPMFSVDETATTTKGVVVNETGVSDVDFRVEGDNDQYLFFCDAGAGLVSIGTQGTVEQVKRFEVRNNHTTGSFEVHNNYSSNTCGLKITGTGGGIAFSLDGHNASMYLKGAGTNYNDSITLGNAAPHTNLDTGITMMDCDSIPTGTFSGAASLYATSGQLWSVSGSAHLQLSPAASDRNIKTNIETIPDALSRVQKISGITFNYVSLKDSTLSFKDKCVAEGVEVGAYRVHGNKKRVGMVAQDVEEAYSGLGITNSVSEVPLTPSRDEDGGEPEILGYFKDLQLATVVPLLVEAIKELSAKVTALENA